MTKLDMNSVRRAFMTATAIGEEGYNPYDRDEDRDEEDFEEEEEWDEEEDEEEAGTNSSFFYYEDGGTPLQESDTRIPEGVIWKHREYIPVEVTVNVKKKELANTSEAAPTIKERKEKNKMSVAKNLMAVNARALQEGAVEVAADKTRRASAHAVVKGLQKSGVIAPDEAHEGLTKFLELVMPMAAAVAAEQMGDVIPHADKIAEGAQVALRGSYREGLDRLLPEIFEIFNGFANLSDAKTAVESGALALGADVDEIKNSVQEFVRQQETVKV